MAERPVECSQCKKAAKVIYKEIIDNKITEHTMCSDCPILHKKLEGVTPTQEEKGAKDNGTGLYCGHCHSSLESIKMGNPMGCAVCYSVFEDILVQELLAENKIPKQMENARRNQPLHIGKTPDKPVNTLASNRLTNLNEALNEALSQENYEEAAWLRDQIKELMDKKDESSS